MNNPWLAPHALTEGTDLASQVPFDRMDFLNTVHSEGPLEFWEDELIAWARSNGRECENLDFAMRKRVRRAETQKYLPAEVPAQKLVEHWEEVAIPASMVATVRYELRGESAQVLAQAQVPGYQVFGKPAFLAYDPATAADQDLLDTYGDILDVPPYLLKLRPKLSTDDQALFEGGTVGAGELHELGVRIDDTSMGVRRTDYRVTSGAALTTVWSSGQIPARMLNEQELALTQALEAGDEVQARRIKFGLMVLGHMYDDGRSMQASSGLLAQATRRQVVSGAAADWYQVSYGFLGVPMAMERKAYLLDMALILVNQLGITEAANEPDALRYGMRMMGLNGSHLERIVSEQHLESPGKATVNALQTAVSQGQTLVTINQANVDAVVPGLGFEQRIKDRFRDYVAAGKQIITHQVPFDMLGLTQTMSYIAEDPVTGAGAYKGEAGHECQNSGDGSAGPAEGCSSGCCCDCLDTSSQINLASGNYFFDENDLILPAVGIPIAFSRRYNSNQYASGALGPGWTHSYEGRLTENPDGSVAYANEEGMLFTFGWDGANYTRPQGQYWELEKDGSGWLMRLKGGMVYGFDSAGRLSYLQDLNGNRVELVYSSGKLDHVLDATGRQALTFTYDGNGQLESVTDAASRVVGFGHDTAGDLVSVTDVLGAQKTFTYDADHHMVSKSDYNGNVHTYSFDSRGRCYRHEDPLGAVTAVDFDYMHRQAVVTDALGHETLHQQDEGGRPIEIVDPLGNSQQMTWDVDNNKTSATDGRGLVTSFTYDPRGNLETRTAPGQGTTTYTYDPLLDRVLTVLDAEGGLTVNTYDPAGNLETSQDAEGKITSYTYNPDGTPETITRPGTAITTLGYDVNGNLETLLDAEGGLTVLGYDPAGHITSVTDPNTHQRIMEVDAKGRIEAIVDPLTNRNEFIYDDEGNRLSTTDPAGKTTSFTFDAMNRIETATDALGNVSRNEWDPLGRLSARVDAKGQRTEYRFDAAGRLTDIIAADGGVTSLGYCADVSQACTSGCGGGAGSASATKACAIIDPEGNLTTVGYDAAGRPTKVTDPLGHETVTQYDDLGRKTAVTDAMGKTTLYRYFPTGRLWQVEDALGGVTEYGYNDRGSRTMVRDANGHETWFEFDLMDRLTKEINPLGKETVFTYDPAGNRDTKLDPNGNLITYLHDENRRLTDIIYPDLSRTHFDFDERGNKIYEENTSVSRTYTYDDLSRVATVTDHVINKTIGYEYGPNGQRTRLIGPEGEETVYRHDALNRIRELIDPDGERSVFSYDSAGRRTGLAFPNGVTGAYLWDQASRLESIVYRNQTGDVLSSFTYTHDDAGNRLSKTFATGGSESYGYDDLHRLTSASYPSGRSVAYDYDPVGNRNFVIEDLPGGSSETTTYSYSDFNQVLSTTNSQGTTAFSWDDNGNLTSKLTPQGALTQYSYNFDNRLSSIQYQSGLTNAFGYDPQGIRTLKEDSEGTTRFLIDQVSVLATFDGGGVQKSWLNHNPQRIDEVLSQVQEAGPPGGDVQNTKLFHLVDGLGSVYGLVNQAGVKVASYGFDAYGALTNSQLEPGLTNNWLFTGRELDADSNWQYSRARYYSAAIGIWNREDPFLKGPISGRENSYWYSRGIPTGEADPLGLFCILDFKTIYRNPTQYLHLGASTIVATALVLVGTYIVSPLTGKIADDWGNYLFLWLLGLVGAIDVGIIYEFVYWNPSDQSEDLAADTHGAVVGSILALMITGVIAPRNMAKARIALAILGIGEFFMTDLLAEIFAAT